MAILVLHVLWEPKEIVFMTLIALELEDNANIPSLKPKLDAEYYASLKPTLREY